MVTPKAKPTLDDLRRLIGYLIITFSATFLYFPFLWLANLWGGHGVLYSRWIISSAFILIFNVAFYFWRYPARWLPNLTVAAIVDALVMGFEYFWLIS